jgi:hypothetical protein
MWKPRLEVTKVVDSLLVIQVRSWIKAHHSSHPFAVMPAPAYIISRVADPIFAVFIGVSAAVTRINREEKAKGKTTDETIQAALR